MTGPVIDLGELRHEPEPDTRPRRPRANGRPLRCALVLLFVLATLVAAGPVSRRAVVPLPARLGANVVVTDDLFLVIDPITPQTPQRRLAAYRLPGGEPVWQVPLPAEGRYWGVTPLAGMLLVTGYEVGSEGRGALTVVLDRATGAYRWQQPGSPVELADGNILFQPGGEDEPGSLRVVDTCCGTVRWQLTTAPGEINYGTAGNAVDRVLLRNADGSFEIRDAATGRVLTRARLRVGGGAYETVQVVDGLLFTVGGTPAMVTAYGLDQLDQRWSTTADGSLYATGCDPVVCLQTRSGRLRAVDPATGRELWSSERWGWVWPVAGRLVATTLSSAGPGAEQLVVLDPPTGRVLADLGRWELAGSDLGGPMIGLRRHPDGGLLVAELDVRAGTVRMLDVLPDANGECQASPGRLLCRRVDGSYGLWRLPD
ncbi:Outer membrane protein assembly factor BamB, contains PQQ-like beta-propeller repeat [Micromonospora coriariae]|uniref:Outer membrane protein assembly factor BamB, contains PQQ-like beta-propeller repeat n=1 Tax=Micromonospora coriariae TaxID=285665 RepID=A0A1C4UQI1_9ACTN|nr:PQQ-binding-like beta-propeller repeat protein [Micromonospora coriariae]SCE73928.1 Outer membrane protein assembly factor BamB, contains PQQ-like beta-propeller repeat [Micromonospora coriariae]